MTNNNFSSAIREIALQIADTEQEIVLVGGQAIVFWAEHYGIKIKDDIPCITKDIDFLASKADVCDLDYRFPQYDLHISFPEMDDPTPNSAKAYICYPGIDEPIEIDFMRTVTGLSAEEIKKYAIQLNVSGKAVHVISPMQLLRSKISNIGIHPNKRDAESIEQARLAIVIANTYLEEKTILALKSGKRIPFQQFNEIASFAGSEEALFSKKYFNLCVMDAIPFKCIPSDSEYIKNELPRVIDRLNKKEERFEKMLERMQSFNKDPAYTRFC